MIYQDVNNNNGNNGVVQQSVQQPQQPPKVAISEPAPMVQQAAQQSFAMKNFFNGGNRAVGRFENTNVVKPPLVNAGESIPEQPKDPAPVTDEPSHAPSWEEMDNMAQDNVNNSNDNGGSLSLSDVLKGGSGNASRDEKSQFVADPEKKDGGFFKWIKGLMPKSRPGMREGETEDEYDRRRTRNMQMVATLADAIRHIGNIVNTSKGATQQKFNSPVELLEQGYQQRKAERQKQAALDADAAYKLADLSLKEKAAEANRSYKDFARQMNVAKFGYQQAKDEAERKRRAERDAENKDYRERVFAYRQQQDKISNNLRQQSINKRNSGGGGGGKKGGSSNSYPLYNPVTGQTEHFKNEKSWIARAAELGYNINTPSSSTTSQEVLSKGGIKKVSNTTRGNSVATQIGKQMAQKKAAAKKPAAKPKGKSGGKKGWASGFKL